jgi:hypothetical protein
MQTMSSVFGDDTTNGQPALMKNIEADAASEIRVR